MLELAHISKRYPMAEGEVVALNDVSLSFRQSEFVAVLGPSGCGKTTLLNIIGGLDKYTSGDLRIDGRSTKDYSDADWDAYRNHSIGFVFQSYNIIPHQSVLSNVELALVLDGVPKAERTRRATKALERVGLGDQLHKKPTMMSGGQMQRVAIARAIVNDPGIILADEPTGALDSKTSVQIMDLLAQIAQDRLVIMVTHNPELAEKYATRTVRLSDGSVVSDSNPPTAAELADEPVYQKPPHTHLPFAAALGLSANNLRTKKGRAFLTAFAGAIGIIGIALILSLSSGMNDYINKLETDVMGSYPLQIDRSSFDMANVQSYRQGRVEENSLMGGESADGSEAVSGDKGSGNDAGQPADPGEVTSDNLVGSIYRDLDSMVKTNNLGAFRTWIEGHRGEIDDAVTDIAYSYDVNPQVWRKDSQGDPVLVSPRSLIQEQGGYASMALSQTSGISTEWKQLVDSPVLREDHYELVAGDWPQEANEVALVVDEDNRISDFYLYTLGLMDMDRMQQVVDAAQNGTDIDDPTETFDYRTILNREYTVFSPSQLYRANGEIYEDMESDDAFMKEALDAGDGYQVHIAGVLKAKESASYTSGVVYTGALTDELMDRAAQTPVVKAQLSNPEKNVLTGKEFGSDSEQAMSSIDSLYGNMMSGMMSYSSYKTPESAMHGSPQALATRPGQWLQLDLATPADVPGLMTVDAATPDDTTSGAGASAAPGDAAPDDGGTTPGDTTPDATTFSVTFKNWDGTVLSGPVEVAQGQQIPASAVPSTPTHAGDGNTTYVFLGWRSEGESLLYPAGTPLPAVEADCVYTAAFVAIPAQQTDAATAAILQALAQLTPEQRALLASALQGNEVTIDDLINAGVITREQVDQLQAEASKRLEEEAQKYLQDYIDSIDTEALMKQYMQQYLGSMDPETLMKRYLAGMDTDELMRQYLAQAMGSGQMEDLIRQYLSSMGQEDLMALFGAQLGSLDLESLAASMNPAVANSYDAVMTQLGYATEDDPYAITFYPKDFESKQKVQDFINEYNAQTSEEDQITYTDMVGLMTRSITEIVDIITAVLLAFVSISLVVSSIMIAIITYISVLERTKEIGILRALGASKGDITRIFNAETFIEGLMSGVMGVVVTMLLNIPISDMIYKSYGAANIAYLPPYDALLLVGISVLLTFVAGFIPARLAAKKDPAVVLRSE